MKKFRIGVLFIVITLCLVNKVHTFSMIENLINKNKNFTSSVLYLPSLFTLLQIEKVYLSPFLMNIKETYSTEIYQEEFKKLSKLYQLTDNTEEKIWYLYQAVIMLYKNGDYKDVQNFSRSLRSLNLNDLVLILATEITKESERLKKESEEYKEEIRDMIEKQINLKNKMKFFKTFRSVDDTTILDLFDLYIYSFQFEHAKKMISQLDKTYFKNPEQFNEMEFKLDLFLRYFGDLNIPSKNLTFLINKNYPDPEKIFNIDDPDIGFILAYKNEIAKAKENYRESLLKRVALMEDLLPYLYLTNQNERFKNFYEKIIFLTNKTPKSLEVLHTDYKVNELKKIYKEVLSQTIFNCYYELINNTNLATANQLLTDIKTFSPTIYIRSNVQ
jgi:hypothetical protein